MRRRGAEARDDVARSLLRDLDPDGRGAADASTDATLAARARPRRGAAIVLGITVPLLAGGLYLLLGEPRGLDPSAVPVAAPSAEAIGEEVSRASRRGRGAWPREPRSPRRRAGPTHRPCPRPRPRTPEGALVRGRCRSPRGTGGNRAHPARAPPESRPPRRDGNPDVRAAHEGDERPPPRRVNRRADYRRRPRGPAKESLISGISQVLRQTILGLRRLSAFARKDGQCPLRIGSSATFAEELGSLHRRQLLRHRDHHELVDARVVLPTVLRDRILQRDGQPQLNVLYFCLIRTPLRYWYCADDVYRAQVLLCVPDPPSRVYRGHHRNPEALWYVPEVLRC